MDAILLYIEGYTYGLTDMLDTFEKRGEVAWAWGVRHPLRYDTIILTKAVDKVVDAVMSSHPTVIVQAIVLEVGPIP